MRNTRPSLHPATKSRHPIGGIAPIFCSARMETRRLRRFEKMNFNERTEDVIEYKGQSKKYRAKMTTFAAFGPGFPAAFSLFNTGGTPSASGLQYELLQHEWPQHEKSPLLNQPTGELTPAISNISMAGCGPLHASATGSCSSHSKIPNPPQ